MTTNLKSLGIFALGFGIGAGVSFVALRHWFDNKFNEELESEREVLRQRALRLAEKASVARSEGPISDPEPNGVPPIVPKKDPLVEAVRASQEASDKVNYRRIMTKEVYEEDIQNPGNGEDEELDDELAEEKAYWDEQRRKNQEALEREGRIALIDEDIFVDNEMDYDQVYLTWYVGDDTLVDLSGDIVAVKDVLGYGGEAWLDSSKEVIYLKNNEAKILIEIVIDKDRYRDRESATYTTDVPGERPGSRKPPRGEWM